VRVNFLDNTWARPCVNHLVRVAALSVIAAGCVFGADPSTSSLLKAVESRYNRAQTLQVNFAETYSGMGQGARTESGVLYLRKPGRMRWEYTQPAGKLFVSDGKDVFLYLPNENRVDKMPLKDTGDMRAPLAFLLGKLNFTREFQNIQTSIQPAGSLVSADPKSESLPYSKVEFLVAPDFAIRKLHIVGQDQSVLDFSFDSEKLNPALASTMFQFHAPPGAQIVENGSGR